MPRRLVFRFGEHLVLQLFVKRSRLKIGRLQVAPVNAQRQGLRLGPPEQPAAEPPVPVAFVYPQDVDVEPAPADLPEKPADSLSVRSVGEVQAFAREVAGVGRVVLTEPSVSERGLFFVGSVALNGLYGDTVPRRTRTPEP